MPFSRPLQPPKSCEHKRHEGEGCEGGGGRVGEGCEGGEGRSGGQSSNRDIETSRHRARTSPDPASEQSSNQAIKQSSNQAIQRSP
eukprot:262917-Prymnesium_polylepis.1